MRDLNGDKKEFLDGCLDDFGWKIWMVATNFFHLIESLQIKIDTYSTPLS